jgi:L-ribulose-5-phosphate 3-epimerase
MDRIIAVNSNCYHGFPLSDAIDGIVDSGAKVIELTATKGWTEHVFPTMSFHELVAVRDHLRDVGLSVIGLSGHCNLRDSGRIPDFRDNIHLAHFFGSRYIVSSVGEAHLKDKKESGDEELVRNIRSFLPLLEEYGMVLVLETHGKEGTGKAVDRIVKMVDSPLVGINYDTANVIFYGGVEGTSDLASCIDDVRYLHVKDKAGTKDSWDFPALGQGYVPFADIFALLDEAGNDAPLSLEIEFTREGPGSLEEVNKAVKESILYLNEKRYLKK